MQWSTSASVLDPIIFNIFTNDLVDRLEGILIKSADAPELWRRMLILQKTRFKRILIDLNFGSYPAKC